MLFKQFTEHLKMISGLFGCEFKLTFSRLNTVGTEYV